MVNTILFDNVHTVRSLNIEACEPIHTKTEYILTDTGLYVPRAKYIVKTPQIIVPEKWTIILNGSCNDMKSI